MRGLATALRDTLDHTRTVLRQPTLSTLVGGSFLGSLTMVVVNLLLTIYVYRDTGSSAIAVSVLFVITFLPNLVVAPLCSGLADRFNRRLLMGLCGIGRAVLCAALLVEWPLPVLLALAFAITSTAAITKPARYALVAQLVSGQPRVALNSLLMIFSTIAGVGGGAVAGLLTSTAGRQVFGVMAGVSVLGAVLDTAFFHQASRAAVPAGTSVHHHPDRADDPEPRAGASGPPTAAPADNDDRAATSEPANQADSGRPGLRLVRGYRLISGSPVLLPLTVATTLLWLGLGLHEPLLVVFVDRVLQQPDATYAYLATVGSIGGLIGAAAATSLAASPPKAIRSFSNSLIVAGACFVGFAASNRSVIWAFLTFCAFSAAYGISNVIDEYLEQELSPDNIRATVISAIGAVGTLGFVVGGAVSGLATTTLGPAVTAGAVGVLIIAAGGYSHLRMRIPREQE